MPEIESKSESPMVKEDTHTETHTLLHCFLLTLDLQSVLLLAPGKDG